jgi:hypothetical protein
LAQAALAAQKRAAAAEKRETLLPQQKRSPR